MHLEVGAQVVGPSLAALLAHPAGEGLRYHRPLPVAVPHHHLPEDSASQRARIEQASTHAAAQVQHQPRANTFCIESNQKEEKKPNQKNSGVRTQDDSFPAQGTVMQTAVTIFLFGPRYVDG